MTAYGSEARTRQLARRNGLVLLGSQGRWWLYTRDGREVVKATGLDTIRWWIEDCPGGLPNPERVREMPSAASACQRIPPTADDADDADDDLQTRLDPDRGSA